MLNILLQKELGRYLFPVFLEKRKSKRHSKKYPPKVTKFSAANKKTILNMFLNDNLLQLVRLLVLNLDLIMIGVTLVMSMTANVPFQFRCSIRPTRVKINLKKKRINFILELKRKMGINPFEGM